MDADAVELRVLGCLLEKQRTTPDQHPLTLNALRNACNQTTNRDPVVSYDESEIHEALQRLAELNPRLAQVVECRYFGGLTELETADALGVTERTVRRDWVKARAWLTVELGPGGAA